MMPPANIVMQRPASVPRASVTSRSRRLSRTGGKLGALGGRGVRCIQIGDGVGVAPRIGVGVARRIALGVAPGIAFELDGVAATPAAGVGFSAAFIAKPFRPKYTAPSSLPSGNRSDTTTVLRFLKLSVPLSRGVAGPY